MSDAPKVNRRPKAYPAPEFPARRPALFAKTPPAIFPVVLGLLGLGLALRKASAVLGLPGGFAEAALGAILALWAFATLAMLVKVLRRPGVILQDLQVLPGRAGMAACSMSMMLAAAVLVPYAPGIANRLMLIALVLHLVFATVLVWVLWRSATEQRLVNPSWHLSFVGFIVAALPALALGQNGLARGLLWLTIPVAVVIWGLSLTQLIGRIPPAPLRPLLAIHLSPAALFCIVAAGLGQDILANIFAALGAGIFLALLAHARWITQAGFSALWGSFTFPLAAFTSALIGLGGWFQIVGLGFIFVALGIVPMIAAKIIKMWMTGALAAKTNAAEA
jgi:tellurite resistance protein